MSRTLVQTLSGDQLSESKRGGGYRPVQPIQIGPPFQWPPQPLALVRWLFGFPGYRWPWSTLFLGIALVSWLLHTVYILLTLALGPSLGQLGFDRVVLKAKNISISTGDYMHYLHHKYFNVNFGAGLVPPLDKWLGTFHDGSHQMHEALKKRVRARRVGL